MSSDYIKQLEDENAALKKKLEDRKYIDKFDEIAMRKLWLDVAKDYRKKIGTVPLSLTPSVVENIAHIVVESYKKEFNIR